MKVGSVNPSYISQTYGKQQKTQKSGFDEMLKGMINSTDNLQKFSSAVTNAAVSGQSVDVHDVMIAGEQARLTFDLMIEVRNKVLDAYRELMQMRM
ncbi:flagellar hook-basal body complex protein FliE [bacterium]|nr:flagellar hook-basal body complex protein FliE [bacterium]